MAKPNDIDVRITGRVAGKEYRGLSTFERLADQLRPPTREQARKSLIEIADDFTGGQVQLFDNAGKVEGRGGWKGLSASRKQKKGHSSILIDKGRLKRSLTDRDDSEHYSLVTISRRGLGLSIGSSTPYARFVNAKRRLIKPTREQIQRWTGMLARLFTKGDAGP